MDIINRFSTIHTTAKPNREIKYIVIHYTAGVTSKAGTALNTADYYPRSDNVSADFTVDDAYAVCYNGDILNRYTWHCGGSKYNTKGGTFYGKCTNANSIGVELCSTNSSGKMLDPNVGYSFTEDVFHNGVELVKQLMKWYNVSADHVIRHYDVTGKLCPGVVGWNKESGSEAQWERFKKAISQSDIFETSQSDDWYVVQVGAFKDKKHAEDFLRGVQIHYPKAIIKKVKR